MTGPAAVRLGNGLHVVVAEDPRLPIVAVHVRYDVGSRHERPGRTGFAHLFEHLMFEGSTAVPPGDHMALLQAAGGIVNGTTSFDRTTYYETVPSERLELALWLEADRMQGLLDALTQQNFDAQREVVKNERRQRMDNVPYGTASERLGELLWPEQHPYRHRPIGSMADLDAASLDECREFFETHYGPDTAVLAVVGDVTAAAAVAAAERYFGDIRPVRRPAGAPPPPLGPPDGEARAHVVERVPAPLVAQSFRLPPDGDPALDAASAALTVLARGRAARLRRRLVRELEVADTVSADVVRLAGGSYATLTVRGRPGADPAAIEAVVDAELSRLGDEPPAEGEHARALAMVERGWANRLASVTSRAELYADYTAKYGDPLAVDAAIAAALSVGPAELTAAAGHWLRPGRRAVVTYEPVAAA